MSAPAPAVDLFADNHTIDRIDRTIDPLVATALALGVLAAASWGAAVATVRLDAHPGGVVLAVGMAAVISMCAAMCWCAASIRHHQRRTAEALCYRIEQDLELRRRVTDRSAGLDVSESWQAYIAGRIDRDE